jgi:tetratricopeptide (TPR) repeat protein
MPIDQPIRATKISSGQTTAEQDLKVALSYVEDVERPFFDKKIKLIFDDTPALFDKLTKAAQYLDAARRKNPDQNLVVEDDKGGPITYTLDDIGGAISAREGHVALLAALTAFNDGNKANALQRSRAAFSKATRFSPSSISYHLNLAEVCKLQSDKEAAANHVAAALKLDPESTDAIKLNDEINLLPDPTQPAPRGPRKSHPFLIAFGIGVVCWVIGVMIASNVPVTQPGAAFPGVLLLLIGLVLTFGSPILAAVLAFKNHQEYQSYRSDRIQEDIKEMANEEHERRYRSEMERR